MYACPNCKVFYYTTTLQHVSQEAVVTLDLERAIGGLHSTQWEKQGLLKGIALMCDCTMATEYDKTSH